jgi:hypothetical protein
MLYSRHSVDPTDISNQHTYEYTRDMVYETKVSVLICSYIR